MNEEEKRKLALAIFQQEQTRLSRTSAINYQTQARLNEAMRHADRQRKMMTSLAQQGITWQELKEAYDEAFNEGHNAMLDHHLSYLYAGASIAYHETYHAGSENTADFVRRIATIPEEVTDRSTLIRKAKDEVGVDTAPYDDDGLPPQRRATITKESHATRKDREAVKRMQHTGITQKDLEIERQLGYNNGWNSGFYFSACYAAVALALHETHNISSEDAQTFIERLEELRYEEITTVDIIERAKDETGVDVSGMIRGTT